MISLVNSAIAVDSQEIPRKECAAGNVAVKLSAIDIVLGSTDMISCILSCFGPRAVARFRLISKAFHKADKISYTYYASKVSIKYKYSFLNPRHMSGCLSRVKKLEYSSRMNLKELQDAGLILANIEQVRSYLPFSPDEFKIFKKVVDLEFPNEPRSYQEMPKWMKAGGQQLTRLFLIKSCDLDMASLLSEQDSITDLAISGMVLNKDNEKAWLDICPKLKKLSVGFDPSSDLKPSPESDIASENALMHCISGHPKLREFQLSIDPKLSDECWNCLAENVPLLESLIFGWQYGGNQIQVLEVKGEILLKLILSKPHLKTVFVGGSEVSDDHWEKIASSQSLVNIVTSNISASSCLKLIGSNPNLRELKVVNKCGYTIQNFLCKNGKIEKLMINFEYDYYVKSNVILEELTGNLCTLENMAVYFFKNRTSKSFEILRGFLKLNPIKKLSISVSKLHEEWIKILEEDCPHLEKLIIQSNTEIPKDSIFTQYCENHKNILIIDYSKDNSMDSLKDLEPIGYWD